MASSVVQFSRSLISSSVGGLTLSEAAEVKNVIQSRTVLDIGIQELEKNMGYLLDQSVPHVFVLSFYHQPTFPSLSTSPSQFFLISL